MKFILAICTSIIVCSSCNNSTGSKKVGDTTQIEKPSFFPVTAYIKGQIHSITEKGINPLKYTTIKDHTDSVWVQAEEFNKIFAPFLTPEIDSANLIGLFTESKFKDRSYNDAYTFTYEPAKTLPDNMSLQRWTVYIDPEKNRVKKVFINKTEGNKETQLTWQNDQWCTIITINHTSDSTSVIEKEEKIVWNF